MMDILGCLDKPSGGEYWLNGPNVAALDDVELASIRNRDIDLFFKPSTYFPV